MHEKHFVLIFTALSSLCLYTAQLVCLYDYWIPTVMFGSNRRSKLPNKCKLHKLSSDFHTTENLVLVCRLRASVLLPYRPHPENHYGIKNLKQTPLQLIACITTEKTETDIKIYIR